MKATRLLSLHRHEWLLLGIFTALNIVDIHLTIVLIGRGYLPLEANLLAEELLTAFGPPNYQFWLLWVFKIGVTFAFIVGLAILARVVPRIRRLVFTLPVYAMTVVCLNNLGCVLWLA